MNRTPRFADRQDAGRQLAKRLMEVNRPKPAIFALPRGGVPVALEVAQALKAPLDLLLVRKIGAPDNPEIALGAVSDGDNPQTIVNEQILRASGASRQYLVIEAARQLEEIERRRAIYAAFGRRIDPRGMTAILVDDGLATGATARIAAEVMRGHGAERVVVAAPVASPAAAALLRAEVDELVTLVEPDNFASVSGYYGDFHQLDDAEVLALLSRQQDLSATP